MACGPLGALPLLAILLACALLVGYLLSPADVLPEASLGAWGLADDVVVAWVAVWLVGAILRWAALSMPMQAEGEWEVRRPS